MTDATARLATTWPLAPIATLGRFGLYLAQVALHLLRPWRQFHTTLRQIHFVGARSVTVIAVAGGFVGMVVALQFHDTLVRFGAGGLLGAAVGLSLVRELAPVLTRSEERRVGKECRL